MSYGINAPQGLQPIATVTGGSWTQLLTERYISSTTAGGITTGYGTSLFNGDPVVFNTLNTGATFDNTAGTIALYNPTYTDGTPSTFAQAPILGVFQSCEYFSTQIGSNNLIKSNYWPAATIVQPGTLIKALILEDPYVIYDIQISTHVNAATNDFAGGLIPALPLLNPAGGPAATLSGAFGSNFALNIGGGTNLSSINDPDGNNLGYNNNPLTGSVTTGQSGYYLDVTTPTGGNLTHDYNKTLATLPLKAIDFVNNPTNFVARNNPIDIPGSPTLLNTAFRNVKVVLNNQVYKAGTLGTIFGAAQN
jgi:hypothetical protein